MDIYQPERKSKGRARERMAARQQRRMTSGESAPGAASEPARPSDQRSAQPFTRQMPRPSRLAVQTGRARERWRVFAQDVGWHIRNDSRILLGIVGVLVVVFVIFIGSYVLPGRIFPNVYALGVSLGGTTVESAAAALATAWERSLKITLVDEERTWEIAPADLGLRLDALATVAQARGVGLAGVPFGYSVPPVVTLDFLTAQNALLDMTETTKIDPYNAGYRWAGDQLVGVEGSPGRYLDVAMTMEALQANLVTVTETGRLQLAMTPLEPEVIDPEPYLEAAYALATQTFQLIGYDPFTNETLAWTTDRDTFTSWLEAGEDNLTLREGVFARFVEAQTRSLAQTDRLRYLEPNDTMEKMREAIANGVPQAYLRIRYRSDVYEVQRGDTGYGIGRRTGLPFYQILQANPGRDWDALLSPGDQVNLPSRDITIPLDPVPHKRIIVDLDTQTLTAYENGQQVFRWLISSGMDYAPTSPGVYQILEHTELASGSSYELCGEAGCGSWQMYWFMGIYEVTPGLMNGFHGAVLLPNGTYLGGGNVGSEFTYGCIMSRNDQAEALFHWAEVGTIVEIISSEYPPQSELGRQARELGRADA